MARKKKKHRHKGVHTFLGLGTLTWIAIMVLSNVGYKAMQMYHLWRVDFNMVSFNWWGLLIAFVGSLAYLIFSFITGSNKWHKILGFVGVVFSVSMIIIFIMWRFGVV